VAGSVSRCAADSVRLPQSAALAWDVQNGYAARPWAVELPSAGKPLSFETLFRIAARGVSVSHVDARRGLSSTGDALLDARLPVAERYEVSDSSAAQIRAAKAYGGRVNRGRYERHARARKLLPVRAFLRSGTAYTDLIWVLAHDCALVTRCSVGCTNPELATFPYWGVAPRALLERSFRHAEREGYLQHEFGDSCLILREACAHRKLRRAG